MCSELGLGIIVIPVVAILANVAIAKAFGKHRYMVICILHFVDQENALSQLVSNILVICMHMPM
jgi:hypothetical protein